MISEEEVKICFEHLKDSGIRLSDSLIQDVLSIMQKKKMSKPMASLQ